MNRVVDFPRPCVLTSFLTCLIALQLFNLEVAQTATVLYVNPPQVASVTWTPGKQFDITINIADVNDLFAWEAHLSWDSSILDFISWSEGPFLKAQPQGTLAFGDTNQTKHPGSIILGVTTVGDYAGVSGSGILSYVTLQVKAFGSSILDLHNTTLLDSKWVGVPNPINLIPHKARDGLFANVGVPEAIFTYSPSEPFINQAITFDASASYDADGYIVNYAWDFGDSTMLNTTDPVVLHSYSLVGSYVAVLNVTDNSGLINTETQIIKVYCLLYVDPPESRANLSERFDIEVYVKDVTELFAWEIFLSWNPSVLEFVAWYEGPFLKAQPQGTYIGENLTVAPGTILIGVTTVGEYKGVSGSGILAYVTFQVKALGSTVLDLHNTTLLDSRWRGQPKPKNLMPHILEDGYFTSGTTPPPSTTIGLSGVLGDNGWFSSDVTITLSATDSTKVEKTEYSFDNINWITYTIPFTITEEGSTIVYYKSTGKAGNPEPTRTKTIKIDKSVPYGSVTIAGGATHTNSLSVTLTLSAEDAASGIAQMRFSHDNEVWTPWETYVLSKAWSLTTGGETKTVYVQFMDNAGLVSSSYQDTITLDTEKPVANAGQGQAVNVGATVYFDASGSTDNLGIVSYEWDFGDGTAETGVTANHTYASQGIYTVTLAVEDAAGNTDSHTITIIVSAEPFPIWIIGVVAATIAIGIAITTTLFRKKPR